MACSACQAGTPLPPLDGADDASPWMPWLPTIGLAVALLAAIYLRRPGGAFSGFAGAVEEEDALESIVQAERALHAISGCTAHSLNALQDAEREIGKAIAAAASTDPEVRRNLQKRISGLTRMASQANDSLTRCITRK